MTKTRLMGRFSRRHEAASEPFLFHIVVVVCGFAVCGALGCSAVKSVAAIAPSEQRALEDRLREMQKAYRSAEKAKNSVQTADIRGKMNLLKDELKGSPIPAKNWVCDVIRVRDASSVDCGHGPATYHLKSPKPISGVLAALKAGQCMTFSGQVVEEDSWTAEGALSEPELVVEINAASACG